MIIMANNKRTALFAGSFDPFTNGHLSIVKEASMMFDEVFVCIAYNPNKKRSTDAIAMKDAIELIIYHENLKNVCVVIHDGLVADFCKAFDIGYLIRGLRNTDDYLYEENIAKINFEINPELKTIYYRAKNDVISSSMVKELYKYGKDISKYVPKDVFDKFYKSKDQS